MRLLLWLGKKDPGAGVAWDSVQCIFCVGVLITGDGGERLALPSTSSAVVRGSRGVQGRWQVLSIQLPLTPMLLTLLLWGAADSTTDGLWSALVCCVSAWLPRL